jgi:hypothetical protein
MHLANTKPSISSLHLPLKVSLSITYLLAPSKALTSLREDSNANMHRASQLQFSRKHEHGPESWPRKRSRLHISPLLHTFTNVKSEQDEGPAAADETVVSYPSLSPMSVPMDRNEALPTDAEPPSTLKIRYCRYHLSTALLSSKARSWVRTSTTISVRLLSSGNHSNIIECHNSYRTSNVGHGQNLASIVNVSRSKRPTFRSLE